MGLTTSRRKLGSKAVENVSLEVALSTRDGEKLPEIKGAKKKGSKLFLEIIYEEPEQMIEEIDKLYSLVTSGQQPKIEKGLSTK